MPTDDEIINAECKELFEWISHYNFDIGAEHLAPHMPEAHKLAIKKAMEKVVKKARVDTLQKIISFLNNKELLEMLAALEYDCWSRWEKYRETIVNKSITEIASSGLTDKAYTNKRQNGVVKEKYLMNNLQNKKKKVIEKKQKKH